MAALSFAFAMSNSNPDRETRNSMNSLPTSASNAGSHRPGRREAAPTRRGAARKVRPRPQQKGVGGVSEVTGRDAANGFTQLGDRI